MNLGSTLSISRKKKERDGLELEMKKDSVKTVAD